MNAIAPELLECIAAIVQEGGFERAARRLSITQSAVSQRLHTLEALTGVVLIVRDRPLRPTPAGRVLLKHAMQMRLIHGEMEDELRMFSPQRNHDAQRNERIAIAVNADSIATWALPAFDPLVQDGLPLEIIADDQDFTQDWLREGQVIGCVTTLAKALRGCKIVHLGAMRYVAAATPATLARYCPDGISPQRIRHIPFIAFNRKDDMQTELVRKAFGLKQINLKQCFVPSSEGQVRAMEAGWGASVVPELLIRPHLEAGTLIDLAPQANHRIDLYWHCWNLDSTLLDALTQALTSAATRLLGASRRKAVSTRRPNTSD